MSSRQSLPSPVRRRLNFVSDNEMESNLDYYTPIELNFQESNAIPSEKEQQALQLKRRNKLKSKKIEYKNQ